MGTHQNRRSAIKNILAGTAAVSALGVSASFAKQPAMNINEDTLKGNINHSVCPWCYSGITLDELCAAGKEIGLKAIDLCRPQRVANIAEIWVIFRHV